MAYNQGPCIPYVSAEELLECCKSATDAGFTDTSFQVLDAIDDASRILYYLMGQTYKGDTCEATIRPCLECLCDSCDCLPPRIDLGFWPVTSITKVRFDGVDQPIGDFHVDEWHYLVRNDGENFPKATNNLFSVAGDANDKECQYVLEITFEHGLAIPGFVRRAARDLACELLSACTGDACSLPDKVSSVARRGISMDIINPNDLLTQGRTGIYSVDLAIMTVNPSKMQSPSFVWSPDLKANDNHNVRTWA